MFKSTSTLDKIFEVSLSLKALDGLLEVVGGTILAFISPATINSIASALTQHELETDPQDFIATHILSESQKLSVGSATFGAVYLISHGTVKILLVAAVLLNKLWAYPLMILFLLLFIAYQIYRFTFTHSTTLVLLTVFDALIVWLTWQEYKKHKSSAQNLH